jgi:hypothetical protein
MKTKMILVQFLRQKNVNLTVAGLARLSDPTFASRSALGEKRILRQLTKISGVLRRSTRDLAIKRCGE